MITPENYQLIIASIDFVTMPEALQKGHQFLMKATSNGTDWNNYNTSATIKKMVQLYFEKLSAYLSNKSGGAVKKQKEVKQKLNRIKTKTSSTMPVLKQEVPRAIMVERMPEELRFIKRFVNLNGKTKNKEDILRFINSLQKAIVEKRIRKTSPYAEQVRYVQNRLIQVYNSMASKIKLELIPETYEELKKLTGVEKVLASIGFIKRYISMNGKAGMKEKAKALLQQINRAYEKGKIADSDPYIVEIHELKKNLKAFTTDKTIKSLEIEQATLNGLEGILGCACNSLNGVGGKPAVMNSVDFANMEFRTLGFTGKWLELIGDPSTNFTAMVFGKPKMGKSYLCIDFAGYLARNHGRVLYVAKEEGLDMTLQKKLADKNVAHSNLFVASVLPSSLADFDFIFLDSVNKLCLLPEDLNELKSKNPNKSFIFIFQSTKDGKFRGANTFQHDVDVVIEVPQQGKATQMGRFNQGGEIEIFDSDLRLV